MPQPHLGGIHDVACQAEPGWQFRTNVEAAAAALQQAKLIAPGPVTAIQVSDQTQTGWPVSLRVDGAAPRTVSAYQAWLAFGQAWGWGKLPGLHFKLQQQGNDVMVQGRGIGHGIGLCQRGTMRMARQGKSAETILATYFPGTKVGRL
jgi:stage II sporulation protein D